jgi:hypothetical protein
MTVRINVYSAERIITGAKEGLSVKTPTGNINSSGHNDGHEWEERVGLEVDLEPSVLANPKSLFDAINTYQDIVTAAVRNRLVAKGAPLNGESHQVATESAAPAPGAAKGTWGNTALPAQATPSPTATKAKAAPVATEPEDESQDDEEEGPPPTEGRHLFGWASKQSDGKNLVYTVWKDLKFKGKVMSAGAKDLRKAWDECRRRIREGEWPQ